MTARRKLSLLHGQGLATWCRLPLAGSKVVNAREGELHDVKDRAF
jgi:hypothetical protein